MLDLLGETFNAISFAGLAVALAVVIDDAVVGAENVARRLRQHREAGSDKSVAQIVIDASHEVRSPLALRDPDRAAGDRAGRGHGRAARARSSSRWRSPTRSRSAPRCWWR